MADDPRSPGDVSAHEAAALVRDCIAGDDAARARLWSGYNGLVRAALRRRLTQLTGNPPASEDVEDLTHDLFVRLMQDDCRALRRLRNARALGAWLVVVARNQAADHLRRTSREDRTQEAFLREEPAAYVASPETRVHRDEQRAQLREQLNQLGERDRLILDLYYQRGLRYADIASILGLNINTVATRLRRAKARLLELMEDGDHDG
jgi:RNA polymerase sigma-70 factor (ECF subfamily)